MNSFVRDLVDTGCSGGGVMRQAAAPIFQGPMVGPQAFSHGFHDDAEHVDMDPMLHHHTMPEAVARGWGNEYVSQPYGAFQHPAHAPPPSWADEMIQHQQLMTPDAQPEGGESWLSQFDQQEAEHWVQDFTSDAVRSFGVEGESVVPMETKKANSEFYKFLNKINSGAIQFDENNQIVELQRETIAHGDGDFASEFLAQPNATEGVHSWADEHLAAEPTARENDEDTYEGLWGSEDNWTADYANQIPPHSENQVPEDVDHWMDEFQKLNVNATEDAAYPFEQNNPYLFHDAPFEEGVSLLGAGTLAAAALAFEAACQKDMYHVEAWHLLGTTQQENEKDPLAILALKKARELDPLALPVYVALAVSFTNEAQHSNAIHALRDWLHQHPGYGDIPAPPPCASDENEFLQDYFYVNPKEHREVVAMYEQSKARNPTDADVHIALGVLHNLSHEYDVAAADFELALRERPNDAKLWNKLGATLANGSRPREAIHAYNRALDLVPGYVRAQYNMGISLSNLGEYADAVRQFIKALHMQQDGSCGDPNDPGRQRYTREIWDVMRMTFHLMDRNDLVEFTIGSDLKALAREFGMSLY